MSEVTDIVVQMLQKIQLPLGRLETDMSSLKEDMHLIKVRVTDLEENMAGMNRCMDKFEVRTERVERRLDLVEV